MQFDRLACEGKQDHKINTRIKLCESTNKNTHGIVLFLAFSVVVFLLCPWSGSDWDMLVFTRMWDLGQQR